MNIYFRDMVIEYDGGVKIIKSSEMSKASPSIDAVFFKRMGPL